MTGENDYKALLERVRARKLTEQDYQILTTELEKVVRASDQPSDPDGRRIVAKLPFGMDIVK